MVKMFYMIVFLLVTTCAYAESPLDKGVYSLGGSISFMHIDRKEGDRNIFEFSPSLRYFIYDNVAVGTSLLYGKTSGNGTDIEIYGIGPTFRYYLPNEKMNPFFEATYSYSKNKSSSLYASKMTSNDYSIGCGLNYFISKNVSIEPMIKYSWRDYKYRSESFMTDMDEESLYVGIGISVFIF